MARRLAPLLVIASFALLVLAFAGCGGDDDSSASGDTVVTETTTTEETVTTETTEVEETEDTETTETSGDVGSAENCEEFAQVGAQISEAVSGTADVDEIKSAFDQLAAAAPDEIKDDFDTLADYMATVAEALQGVDVQAGETPDPAALQKLASIDATAATAASTAIAAWVTENCTGATP